MNNLADRLLNIAVLKDRTGKLPSNTSSLINLDTGSVTEVPVYECAVCGNIREGSYEFYREGSSVVSGHVCKGCLEELKKVGKLYD